MVLMAVVFSCSVVLAEDCLVKSISALGTGNWEIIVSLEGLPEGEVFMFGQIYLDGPWQDDNTTDKFSIQDNGDNTATISLADWPAGEYFSFSYGQGIWSPTIKGWMDPSCSDYEHEGYFRIKLGIKPLAPPVDLKMAGAMVAVRSLLLTSCQIPVIADTGDSMILGVEDLGEGKYRLYLNFDGLIGFQKFFVGEKAPNDAWEKKAVQRVRKCQVVDIEWNCPGQKVHFSWYAQAGGKQNWADAEGGGSKYATCLDGSGHKQFCFDPAQVVADLAGSY